MKTLALDDYDWSEVMAYGAQAKVCTGASCSSEPFSTADVAQVIASDPGENDGAAWVIAGLLNDTRYFFIEAGCDYTGWGCQQWGTAWVAEDLGTLLRFGLTDDARERLPAVRAAAEER